jgi:2-polyprenyl-3-methyl-5-hydroxy-6-metoxy-1,4-benzoquinol methylase
MDQKIIKRLLALNRAFYATFAQSFADSRSIADPALACILPHIPQRARVLDVGCGNGRLALLLDHERPDAVYLGVDAIPELIEIARAQAHRLTSVSAEYRVIDVTRRGWSHSLHGPPSPYSLETPFDCIVILAVLHHVPSLDLRTQVLREAASLLASDGRLIISTWQFLDSARMRRKIVGWAEVSIAEESLEPGDYLLDWKREGRGLRYCHMVDKDEVQHLAAAAGLHVWEAFRAGGREGDLSLYAVLSRGREREDSL